jgi:HEAT repeat protein
MANPLSLEDLIHQLGSDNDETRATAASWMSSIKDPAAIPHLLQALNDPNYRVRGFAVRALGYLEATAELDAIINRLHDNEVFVRREAVRVIHKIGDDRKVSALVACLDDDDEGVRHDAAMYLCPTNDPRAISKLRERLPLETAYTLAVFINTLGCSRDSSLIPDLAPFLKHTNPAIRFHTIGAFGDLKSPDGIPYLLDRLDDSGRYASDRLYNYAAKQLVNIGTKEALQAVEKWRSETVLRRSLHRAIDMVRFILVGDSASDPREYSIRLIILAVAVIMILALMSGVSIGKILLGLVIGVAALAGGLYAFFGLLALIFWLRNRFSGPKTHQ